MQALVYRSWEATGMRGVCQSVDSSKQSMCSIIVFGDVGEKDPPCIFQFQVIDPKILFTKFIVNSKNYLRLQKCLQQQPSAPILVQQLHWSDFNQTKLPKSHRQPTIGSKSDSKDRCLNGGKEVYFTKIFCLFCFSEFILIEIVTPCLCSVWLCPHLIRSRNRTWTSVTAAFYVIQLLLYVRYAQSRVTTNRHGSETENPLQHS